MGEATTKDEVDIGAGVLTNDLTFFRQSICKAFCEGLAWWFSI